MPISFRPTVTVHRYNDDLGDDNEGPASLMEKNLVDPPYPEQTVRARRYLPPSNNLPSVEAIHVSVARLKDVISCETIEELSSMQLAHNQIERALERRGRYNTLESLTEMEDEREELELAMMEKTKTCANPDEVRKQIKKLVQERHRLQRYQARLSAYENHIIE